MPPNVAITRGDQNPYWKHDIKMSQLFLRVSFRYQSEELALKRHQRLFTHLLPYDYPDLTLSGGAGVVVLRTARAAADRPFR
jgi:hypothetical protein